MCLALGACGKSEETRTVTVAVHQAQGSGGATQQVPAHRALASARAINLRAGDVPGFRASPHQQRHEGGEERRLKAQLQRCVHVSGAREQPVESDSPEFSRHQGILSLTVSSGVTVHSSAAIAQRELQTLHRPGVRACLHTYVERLLKGKAVAGSHITPVSIAEGSPPAPGTNGSYAWRIKAGLLVHGVKIPFYMDILGFVYGRNEVALQSFGLPVPLPARAQEDLFALLLERAKTFGIR
jgi:hypothetical protein